MKTLAKASRWSVYLPAWPLAVFLPGLAALALFTGCQSQPSQFEPVALTPTNARSAVILSSGVPVAPAPVMIGAPVSNTAPANPAPPGPAAYILREGDTLKISFPGSPNLNSVQQIRTDGKITLPLAGEVTAAGLTPDELQRKLIDLYASQLTTKEVVVEIQNSSFPVYITGAVLHPGKISTDHPITALEAIMEAGGPDYTKANLKDVEVIRQESNRTKHYQLNLKQVIEGRSGETFYMKPADIIYVPEKFSWF